MLEGMKGGMKLRPAAHTPHQPSAHHHPSSAADAHSHDDPRHVQPVPQQVLQPQLHAAPQPHAHMHLQPQPHAMLAAQPHSHQHPHQVPAVQIPDQRPAAVAAVPAVSHMSSSCITQVMVTAAPAVPAAAVVKSEPPPPPPPAPAPVPPAAADPMAVDQEEADAAAALLGFGFGPSSEPAGAAAAAAVAAAASAAAAAAAAAGQALPHGMLPSSALSTLAASMGLHTGPLSHLAGVSLVDANGVMSTPVDPNEPEYLVKWSNKSHVHNEWVKESMLMSIARRKLLNFKKRHGDKPCTFVKAEWVIPERFVARRPSPSGPGWEVLVKWTGLGCEQATWEVEGESVLLQPEYMCLHKAMWAREEHALQKATTTAAHTSAAALASAKVSFPELSTQPAYVTGGKLYPHQLAGVNWLRSMYVHGSNAILADERGLGRTATLITYLQSLLFEFKACGPLLVVVPQSMLDFWEGEFKFWAAACTLSFGVPQSNNARDNAGGASAGQSVSGKQQPINLICYSGSSLARHNIQEHELWMNPSSRDGKLRVSAGVGVG